MKFFLAQVVTGFSLLYIVSCNGQQAPVQSTVNVTAPGVTGAEQPKPTVVTDTIPFFTWKVAGCAAENDRKSLPAEKQNDNLTLPGDPEISVKGDSVTYTRSLKHLCCRQVKISTLQKDSLLTITEYWYRQGCKCHCISTVSAVLKKLAKGNYQLYIIETGTDPFDDKPMLSQDTIWSQKVIIQ